MEIAENEEIGKAEGGSLTRKGERGLPRGRGLEESYIALKMFEKGI